LAPRFCDSPVLRIRGDEQLKNAWRGGDVWVPGSGQFKDFDEYLLPRDNFNRRQIQGQLGLPVPTSAQAYLDDRLALLRQELDVTNKLAAAGELPDVEITERGFKISPIEDDTPDGAEALRFQAYDLLPRVKITDLLLEVDQWTNFSGTFSHLKTGEEHQDRTLLLTAILADAFNLAALLASVAPLGWNHINLTGDYRWQGDKRVAKGHSGPSAARYPQRDGLSVQKFPFLEVTPT
jgi:hypothetical protein